MSMRTHIRAMAHEKAKRRGAGAYTHLRAHETVLDLVWRRLLEKKKRSKNRIV